MRHHSVGFTLIEVLIAMAVFAVMSVMTFRALEGTLRVQEQVEKHAESLNEFLVVWTIIMRDFANLARRPVRNSLGQVERAFEQNQDDSCSVSFTRSGVQAGGSFVSAGMQRIAYCFEDGGLYRAVWPVLDRSEETEPQKSLLLDNVEEFVVELDTPLPPLRGAAQRGEYEYLPDSSGILVFIRTGDGSSFKRRFPGVGIR